MQAAVSAGTQLLLFSTPLVVKKATPPIIQDQRGPVFSKRSRLLVHRFSDEAIQAFAASCAGSLVRRLVQCRLQPGDHSKCDRMEYWPNCNRINVYRTYGAQALQGEHISTDVSLAIPYQLWIRSRARLAQATDEEDFFRLLAHQDAYTALLVSPERQKGLLPKLPDHIRRHQGYLRAAGKLIMAMQGGTRHEAARRLQVDLERLPTDVGKYVGSARPGAVAPRGLPQAKSLQTDWARQGSNQERPPNQIA